MGAITFTMTDDTIVDLTDTSVNPDAAEVTTPRQGGFTLRNRWDCAKLALSGNDVTFAAGDIVHVTSAATATFTHTPFTVLEVPERTMVNNISLYNPTGKTGASHQFYYSGSASSAGNTASNIKSTTLTFYGAAWKKSNGTSVATHVDGLGEIDLAAVGASASGGTFGGSKLGAATFSTSSSSKISTPTNAGVFMENTMASLANAATSFIYPLYFPHGGRIIMKLADAATSLSSSSATADTELAKYSGKIAGNWEIQANCNYVPA
jgi:hypothetical protein